MKKVLSLMIVVAAAAMVSCAGKQAKQAETVEVEATEVVETPASVSYTHLTLPTTSRV